MASPPWSVEGGLHARHRHVGQVDHLGGDGAEQHAGHGAEAARAHDDAVAVLFERSPGDGFRDRADQHLRFVAHLGSVEDRPGGHQDVAALGYLHGLDFLLLQEAAHLPLVDFRLDVEEADLEGGVVSGQVDDVLHGTVGIGRAVNGDEGFAHDDGFLR